jgi:hypothetical protein
VVGPARREGDFWSVFLTGPAEALERFRVDAEKIDASFWKRSLYGLDEYSSDQAAYLLGLRTHYESERVRHLREEGLWHDGKSNQS